MDCPRTNTSLGNVVVVGGSYVGTKVAERLAAASQDLYRIILVEKNSHFQHIFSFPRFAATTAVSTQKAFIPYKAGSYGASSAVVQAEVTGLTSTEVKFDRMVQLDGKPQRSLPYSFLVIATGTKLSAPCTLPTSEKLDGVNYLRQHAEKLYKNSRIVIIGAGAVGVQMATDIKELYPEKTVTLVHSRQKMMTRFHEGLHNIVKRRCEELGIITILGLRVVPPKWGYPTDGKIFNVHLEDGSEIPCDFAIFCTGQVPQGHFLQSLSNRAIRPDGFVRVLKTLQVDDTECPNVFALGDVAATGAHKAAKPAFKQADIVTNNILHISRGEPLEEYSVSEIPRIDLTLGIEESVIFGNPPPDASEGPTIQYKCNGNIDMGIDNVWSRRGGGYDTMT